MKTDLEIQNDVMNELKWAPLLHSNEIGVAVKHGVVTLTGTVDTYTKKIEAENATKRVAGVKAVAEEIIVKPKGRGLKNDTEIAEAVLNALKWHSAVQEEKIKVKVENGWVYLDGSVEWDFQRTAVKSAIESLTGVRGITNMISIVPKVSLKQVRSKIEDAFKRNSVLEADHIHIEVSGNKITLSGTVNSLAEKEEAERAAWATPGVIGVENKLLVESSVYV